MRKASCLIAGIGLVSFALGGGKPLANVPKYDGKFMWVKLPALPSKSLKQLAHAKSILIKLSFPRAVTLRRDKGGNQWFTLVLADQGSDWKWHQTKGSAVVPIVGGVIKAGTYTLVMSVSGIPGPVLADKKQTISLGPNTSGLSAPTAFSIVELSGK